MSTEPHGTAAESPLAASLAHVLRNRFYVGEVVFKGDVLKGEQHAIVDRALFDAVQAKLNEQPTIIEPRE